MIHPGVKGEAILLRKKGFSLSEISRSLGASKSSVSGWCKGVALSEHAKNKILKKQEKGRIKGRRKAAEINRTKRQKRILDLDKSAIKELSRFSSRELLILLIGLFWAEGSKTDQRFIFSNSDPDMINLVCYILTKVMGIDKSRIRITIQINSVHKKRIKKVIDFWRQYLGFAPQQFNSPYFIEVPPKKVYENFNEYCCSARGFSSLCFDPRWKL